MHEYLHTNDSYDKIKLKPTWINGNDSTIVWLNVSDLMKVSIELILDEGTSSTVWIIKIKL